MFLLKQRELLVISSRSEQQNRADVMTGAHNDVMMLESTIWESILMS